MFFNSVIQLLYPLTSLSTKIQSYSVPNNAVFSLQNLFQAIKNGTNPIKTSTYLLNIGIPDYLFGTQYDSHECLLHLIDIIYPVLDNNCIFKIDMLSSVTCENNGCNNIVESLNSSMALTLNVDESHYQTINNLLDSFMSTQLVPDYRCDRCSSRGHCLKANTIVNTGDVLVIQLSIFKYINGISTKISPYINIDETISFYGNTMSLHGIIYHDGEQTNSGHYTAGVKLNGNWFTVSDALILNGIKLSCTSKTINK